MVDDYDIFLYFMCSQCGGCALSVVPNVSMQSLATNVGSMLMPYLVSFWATYCLPALASTVSQLQM